MFGLTALLVVVAVLLSVVSFGASIWLVVVAFRRSVLWGLGVLLVPFAAIAYAVLYWQEAKKPFLIGAGSGVAACMVLFTTLWVGAAAAAKHVAAELSEPTPQIASDNAPLRADETPERDLDASAPLRAAPAARQMEDSSELAAARARDVELLVRKRAKLAATKRAAPPYDPEQVTGDGFAPLALRDSAWAIGRQVKVVARGGQTHKGELVRAGATGFELRQFVGAGTVNIEFGPSEVDTLYVKTDPIVADR